MASYNFIKNIVVKYDTTNFPSDTRNQLVRTYSDKIVDNTGAASPDQVSIYYNGQKIRRHVAEATASFAKFYYELTIDTSTPLLTVTIHSNPAYVNTSYSSMSALDIDIKDDDIFYIEYIYRIDV